MTHKQSGLFYFISHNRLLWLVIVAAIAVSTDQASKIWAQNYLAEAYVLDEPVEKDGEIISEKKTLHYPIRVVEVVPNFFNLIYKENPAAAFSLTRSIPLWIRKPMLIGVSLFATIFFLFWYFRMKNHDGLLLGSFSFILSGAVGNLADRIRLGYVIDFLDVHAGILGYPHLHWPTFNVADSFIVVGAIGVIIRTLWPLKEENGSLQTQT